MSRRVLVTGGAGYIGAHTVLTLLERGDDVMVFDNLSNGSAEAVRRVGMIAGVQPTFCQVDLCDADALLDAAKAHAPFDAVIHFAALKAVGESVKNPLIYYQHNLQSSLNLCAAMKAVGCQRVVFSSSATVYGDPATLPVDETAPVQPVNPYGQTKAMIEQILWDIAQAEQWHLANLRYFNPVGAHSSGWIGEDCAYPNNLMPFVSQVAVGQREEVVVFGDDWDTADGSGVRDYIHVMDLAQAHLAALDAIWQQPQTKVWNIGTGRGYSVKEVVQAYRDVSQQPVPMRVGPRRVGDVAEVVADGRLAQQELNWQARYGLQEMVASSWRWQSQNPQGYQSATANDAQILQAIAALRQQKRCP